MPVTVLGLGVVGLRESFETKFATVDVELDKKNLHTDELHSTPLHTKFTTTTARIFNNHTSSTPLSTHKRTGHGL